MLSLFGSLTVRARAFLSVGDELIDNSGANYNLCIRLTFNALYPVCDVDVFDFCYYLCVV